ncbi:MAG: hypothetical protein IID13_02030 [Candidatus Marinimicrobia bacterium]|nr:hypothetical protein [Candidatus Neomarinimicrobiota bacterium]
MVGSGGRVVGIDMTPEMLSKARAGAAEMGLTPCRVQRRLYRAATASR